MYINIHVYRRAVVKCIAESFLIQKQNQLKQKKSAEVFS